MSRLGAGIHTFLHWKGLEKIAAQHGSKIDGTGEIPVLQRNRSDAVELLRTLARDGVVAVAEYWTADKCAAARAEIDRLLFEYPEVVQKFSGGADKRMFGVETKSELLAEFHSDPFLHGVGEHLGGFRLYNFATLGARIDATSENNGSGDGWHRDAHGYQYKAILYLSDVGEDNGPFEYLVGSHTRWRAAMEASIGGLPPAPNTRYEPAPVERMVRKLGIRVAQFRGKAGTLLLVNTSGIHRGRPLRAGSRHALTNYCYHPFQIDENRIKTFPAMLPGTAERIRADLLSP